MHFNPSLLSLTICAVTVRYMLLGFNQNDVILLQHDTSDVRYDDDWEKIGQTGTAKDWCDDWGISFVEVEGSTRYGSDWKIQKPAIEAVLKYLEEIA